MKTLSITLASAAILAAASFGASAQTPPEKQEAPGASRQGAGQDGGQRAKPEPGQAGGRETQMQEQPKSGERDKSAQQQGAAEKPGDMDKGDRAGKPEGGMNKDTAQGQKQDDRQKPDGDRGKDSVQGEKQDSQKPDGDRGRDSAQGEKQDSDRAKSADQQPGGAGKPEKQATREIKPEQKTVIRETIVREKIRPEKINVQVRVGVAIPRTVRLYALPPTLIEVYPAYRPYKLVMIDDNTLLVIDPVTWEIVDVIEV